MLLKKSFTKNMSNRVIYLSIYSSINHLSSIYFFIIRLHRKNTERIYSTLNGDNNIYLLVGFWVIWTEQLRCPVGNAVCGSLEKCFFPPISDPYENLVDSLAFQVERGVCRTERSTEKGQKITERNRE